MSGGHLKTLDCRLFTGVSSYTSARPYHDISSDKYAAFGLGGFWTLVFISFLPAFDSRRFGHMNIFLNILHSHPINVSLHCC